MGSRDTFGLDDDVNHVLGDALELAGGFLRTAGNPGGLEMKILMTMLPMAGTGGLLHCFVVHEVSSNMIGRSVGLKGISYCV